ncbi:hypothetical protein [Luteibacter sp. ME-Dv--P-043b]|uniref:hypothetical protein n=1 Tax=Luteibacter sp. ME-Dv--P-043b TaxID=3040291 RepID=UPI0025522072|nr:hypothetical protein [Luteibacter sp. ME-Dv--P-043b]
MRMGRLATLAATAALAGLGASTAVAQNFALNNFNLMVTNEAKPDPIFGYGTPDRDLQMFQFEHFSTHDWGDVYFDAELYHGRDVGAPFELGNDTQNLFVLNPRLSIGRLADTPIHWGPLSDLSVIARWESGSYPSNDRFHSQNYGLSANFDVGGFAWFESGLLYRHTNFDRRTWLWRSVLLSKPIDIGGQAFHFNLLSLVNGSDHQGTEVLERADVLWEAGHHSEVQLGFRLEYARYDHNPVASGGEYHRFTPFLMLKLTP